MTAVDVEPQADFGLRTEAGVAPAPEPTGDVFGAAFRQSNSFVSAIQYMRNSGQFAPVPDYNPLTEIKGWGNPGYFLEHGEKFVGSQSPAETLSIKGQIDQEEADKRLLSANGKIGFVAQTMAGILDPTMLLPGGIGIDAARGGLSFTKAAVEMGKAGFMQSVAQEALLHASQDTRTFSESALNVASGTLLTALIGGGAASLLSPAERVALETRIHADRSEMNAHAGNPSTGEFIPAGPNTHDVFHGTGGVFETFDPAKLGTNTEAPSAKEAFFFSKSHETANSYLPKQYALRHQLPPDQLAKLEGLEAQLAHEESGISTRSKIQGIKDQISEIQTSNTVFEDGANVRLARVRLENPLIKDFEGRRFRDESYAKVIADAKAAGHDGVIFKNTYDGGPLDDVYAVFDPSQISGRHPTAPVAANANEPAGTALAASAGAAATDTRKIELVDFGLNQIPGVRNVVEKTSPMQRLFGAESVTVRRTAADLAETSLLTKENLEGKVTTAGPALDREARLNIHQGQVAVGDELSRLFSEYRFGDQDRSVGRAVQKGFENITGRVPEGKMTFDQFKEAVTDALRNGDVHQTPQVQMAAQTIRNKVFEPWKKRAIDAGLLPEGVDVKTADSYVQRLYNKQAIAAKRPEFVNRVTDWLTSDQAAKAQAKDRIEGLAAKLQETKAAIDSHTGKLAKMKDDDLFRGGHEEALIRANAEHDLARRKIEEEIASWEGKSTAEAKSALKVRERAETERAAAIAEGTSKSKGSRLASADKAVDKAVKRILESDRDMTRGELESRAQEITDRIIGSPDGRLPYDLGMEHGQGGGGSGEAPRGALAAREFNIPDATIKDFLENDAEHIVAAHLRTMVPDVLLTEKFGDTRMTEAFRKINDEYAALASEAKSEGARTKLEKERQRAIDDLSAVRDRIRGVYGISADAPMRNAARAMNVLKNYNVLTSMGSAALSSLPDMAGSVLRHGLTSTFNDAWAPFFSMLTRQSDVWQEAGRQYRAMGIAVESVLASRHHALTDTLDTYHPQSRVERTMQWATGKFQFVNMLAPWTDFAKINASMVAGSEILRAVKAAAEGKANARQLRNLGESGIEPHMAPRIAKAFEDGGEIKDGVHLPNTADWADKEARRVFEGAVARDADIAVVTPGQEKPLWMSHPLLSVLGQFKSFTAAATERVLISNLQRRDAQVLQGMIFSMGLGMLSYKLNSLTGGQPTSDKPQDWIKESISRGNLLGWFEEANALASKATRGGVDVYRVIGAEKPLSRYASRSAMDQILGPTAGKIGGILSVASAASKPSEWKESDSKALRRLIASQNVFYLRGLFNQVEAAGNNAFGIEMKAKPENR